MDNHRRTSSAGIPRRVPSNTTTNSYSSSSSSSGIPRPQSSSANHAPPPSAIPRPSSRASYLPQPTPSRPRSSSSSSTSGANVAGPLGSYRPPSRNAAVGQGGSTFAPTPSSNKRSASAAGLVGQEERDQEDAIKETPLPPNYAKRPMKLTSPRLLEDQSVLPSISKVSASPHPPPPSSPGYELSVLRADYERRALADKKAYEELENQVRSQGRQLDIFHRERAELLEEWEREQASKREREKETERVRAELESRVSELMRRNAELHSSINEVQLGSANELRQEKTRSNGLEARLGHVSAQLESVKDEVKRLTEENQILTAQRDDLENALEDEKRERIKEREESRIGGDEGRRISEELTSECFSSADRGGLSAQAFPHLTF
ncbi:hypothetical protein IE53DRAFT_371395 [Violaceomyces palustris]|uniref:Uncharacterized protein n=1 Tax=Violaceomyces palustris TaxID=1673888 RepID=A0ACD0NP07_9BASI|nr:hypothetical protein IE53DRAFT_371395 [Violaceomyces palustris]